MNPNVPSLPLTAWIHIDSGLVTVRESIVLLTHVDIIYFIKLLHFTDIRPVGLCLWLLQTITKISVWVFMYTFSWYSFPKCSPLTWVIVYSSTYIAKNNYFNSHQKASLHALHPHLHVLVRSSSNNSCSSAVGICWAKILSGIPGKTIYSQRGNKEGIKKRKGVIRSSRTKGQGRIGYQRGKEAVS